MRIRLLFSFYLFICLNLTAQESIYNSHYFKKGLKVTYQPIVDSLIVYEDSGNDITWNYSKVISKGNSYIREIQNANTTPHRAKFPEANIAIVGQNKDYVYLNVSHSKTEFIGFMPPDSSYVVYNYQPWSISIHPMKLGDTLKVPIARYIKVGAKKLYRHGSAETFAIGHGKLILPNKTYENVLKIKEVQTFYNPLKTTFYQATTYHWLSNERNFPVMSCNKIIDRNNKGEEQVTQFAQILVNEKGTQENMIIRDIEKEKFNVK